MRIILVKFTERFEAFTSLKPFFDTYPQYAELKDKIDHVMSRKKQNFEHEDFTLYRLSVQ